MGKILKESVKVDPENLEKVTPTQIKCTTPSHNTH